MSKRKILLFTALPYINNALHLGHFLEYIQADIWVKFQKMRGHEVYFIGGDDTHGTPIMLRAEALGITPEELLSSVATDNQKDYAGFGIDYDAYGSTNSPENKEMVNEIYQQLVANNLISKRTISQLYDPERGMFLPDRYVKGICPKCKSPDQYGDSCEVCATTYTSDQLINPRSVLSGATPELRDSEHYFFDLPKLEAPLQEWNKQLLPELANKMQEWFTQGLLSWDISRDAPYFGFQIPGTKDKYFYVWLDAPIGYLSTFKSFCQRQNISFDEFWQLNSKAEIYNIIGKDILYFHTLFWPAMLHGANLRKPTNLIVHGHVTINGVKMSKSRGTFIRARTYLKHLDAQALRYYFASKLRPNIVDVDLNLDDFINKINSDLVNKLANLASRSAKFINKYFSNKLSIQLFNPDEYEKFQNHFASIAQSFEKFDFAKAIREIMSLSDIANKFVDNNAPWVLAKEKEQHLAQSKLHQIVSQAITYFRDLTIVLSPVVPEIGKKSANLFKLEKFMWEDLSNSTSGIEINQFTPIYQRIDPSHIRKMLDETQEEVNTELAIMESLSSLVKIEKIAKDIEIQQFSEIDLRVAKVIDCAIVEGSDKLLRFTLDLGEGKNRNVFSGIKKYYPDYSKLINSNVVVVANLKARKMKFGISQGMILSAQDPITGKISLLSCDQQAAPGSKVS